MTLMELLKRKNPNELHDKDNDLRWLRVYRGNIGKQIKYFDEIREWSTSSNIRHYVSSKITLDKLFSEILFNDTYSGLYFCFVNNELAGIAYTTYATERRKEMVIEYVVVKPSLQSTGIGTRMISSITNNTDFFSKNACDTILSVVEEGNIASRKAFLKNNYIVVSKNLSYSQRNNLLYACYKKELDKEPLVNGDDVPNK